MRFGPHLIHSIIMGTAVVGLSLVLVGCTSDDAESAAVNVWDAFASVGDSIQTAISNNNGETEEETAPEDGSSPDETAPASTQDEAADQQQDAADQQQDANDQSDQDSADLSVKGTEETTSASRLQKVTIDYVSDGDTMNVLIDGVSYRVRLIGVDTPESKHYDETLNTEEGVLAGEHTKALLPKGTTVWIEKDTSEYDQYGRLLRYVWLEEPDDPDDPEEVRTKMLNAILVEDGWATAKSYWPDTKWKNLFAQLQEEYELSLQQEAS